MDDRRTRDDDAIESPLGDLSDLAADGGRVAFGDLVDRLGARGFGPLLMILSLFLLVPIGAIPGVPAAVGIVVVAIGAQVARGARGLWLPGPLKRMGLPATRLQQAVRLVRPPVAALGRVLRPRLGGLAEGRLSVLLIGAVLVLVGTAMIFVGFVPLLPILLALPVLVFGIGLTARDGAVVLIGHAALLPSLVLLWRTLLGG